ncbi:hypothetical protein [Haladaptatus salinisoli]|uniref:hypothetical protein n=1 Tax=Haladaptatus salinisoli TaxID=2884876 RepID=UPI001D0AF1DF|nr:hypothetical protein [Haladaptatus salinisoli]
MTRFRKIGTDESTYRAAGHVFIVLAGIALAHATFQVALTSGVGPLTSHAIGGVVALFGGFVLAQYEMAVGFGER